MQALQPALQVRMKILPAVYVLSLFSHQELAHQKGQQFDNKSLLNLSAAIQMVLLPAAPPRAFAGIYCLEVGSAEGKT